MAMYPKTLLKEAFLNGIAGRIRNSRPWKAYEGAEKWVSDHARGLGFGGAAVGVGAVGTEPVSELLTTLRRGYKAERVAADVMRDREDDEDVRTVAG